MNDHVHPTLAGILNNFAGEFEKANAEARRERDKRDWATLKDLIKRHGVSNVAGIMADEVGEMADGLDAQADEDYELAAEILQIAATAVDLAYGMQPANHNRIRRQALMEFQQAAMRIKA